MNYKRLTAPCGIACFNCPVCVDKPSLKTAVMSGLVKLMLFKKLDFKKRNSVCRGCRDEEGKCRAVGFTEPCKIYACSTKKGVEFCFQCAEFPCDHLQPYRNKSQLPHNTKMYNLCLIKKMGVEEWAQTKATEVAEKYNRGRLNL